MLRALVGVPLVLVLLAWLGALVRIERLGAAPLRVPEARRPSSRPTGKVLLPEGAGLPAPQADGDPWLEAHVREADREAFRLVSDANHASEAGRPVFSSLRTTAGPRHRASFGVAQLTIAEHLRVLSTLSDEELASLSLERSSVDRLRAAAEAMRAWYTFVVDGGPCPSTAGTRCVAARQCLARDGEEGHRCLVRVAGSAFAEDTGLVGTALREVAMTRWLGTSLRARFGEVSTSGNGRAPRPTDARVMAFVELEPRARQLYQVLGADSAALRSLGHYLAVGDRNEHLHGWMARAIAAALPGRTLESFLAPIDAITTRERDRSNFEAGCAAVAGVIDLHGGERARMIARIARAFHGAPARARRAFFYEGDVRRPRATSASELEAMTRRLREGREWSDARIDARVGELLGGSNAN